MIHRG
jgi:hypothetical protein